MQNSLFHRVLVTVVLSLFILDSALAGCSWDAAECSGHVRVCKYGWWTKVIMLAITAAIVTGAAAAGAGGIVGGAVAAIVAKVLALFGFLPTGIGAGSLAAWIQSVIGSVKAGSLFAYLQSIAAKGVSGSALAALIAKYVAANGLPLSIAQIFALDCYWEVLKEDL